MSINGQIKLIINLFISAWAYFKIQQKKELK